MHYVYAIYSRQEGKFYIGYSSDLRQRWNEHLSGRVRTTKQMADGKLIYYEACVAKKDALLREKQLKTGFGRGYLKKRLKYSLDD